MYLLRSGVVEGGMDRIGCPAILTAGEFAWDGIVSVGVWYGG
jgi:hypothetical protein